MRLKDRDGDFEVLHFPIRDASAITLIPESRSEFTTIDTTLDNIAGPSTSPNPAHVRNPFGKVHPRYRGPMRVEGYHNSSFEGIAGVRAEGFDFSKHRRGTWGVGAYLFTGWGGKGYNPGGPGEDSLPLRADLKNVLVVKLDQVGAIDRSDPGQIEFDRVTADARHDPHRRRELMLEAGYDGLLVLHWNNDPYVLVAYDPHGSVQIVDDADVKSVSGILAVGDEPPRGGDYTYLAGADTLKARGIIEAAAPVLADFEGREWPDDVPWFAHHSADGTLAAVTRAAEVLALREYNATQARDTHGRWTRTAGVTHRLLYRPPGHRLLDEDGAWGRGIVFPDGSVHTWPEEEATHSQWARAHGYTGDIERLVSAVIRPDGWVDFYGDGASRADAEKMLAADPRLSATEDSYKWLSVDLHLREAWDESRHPRDRRGRWTDTLTIPVANTRHELGWFPGQLGKGWIRKDGQVVTWQTNSIGWPDHVLDGTGLVGFTLAPTGAVFVTHNRRKIPVAEVMSRLRSVSSEFRAPRRTSLAEAAIARGLCEAYDPNQPRVPKGQPRGGQWIRVYAHGQRGAVAKFGSPDDLADWLVSEDPERGGASRGYGTDWPILTKLHHDPTYGREGRMMTERELAGVMRRVTERGGIRPPRHMRTGGESSQVPPRRHLTSKTAQLIVRKSQERGLPRGRNQHQLTMLGRPGRLMRLLGVERHEGWRMLRIEIPVTGSMTTPAEVAIADEDLPWLRRLMKEGPLREAAIARGLCEAYDPNQPRHPAGSPRGGQWSFAYHVSPRRNREQIRRLGLIARGVEGRYVWMFPDLATARELQPKPWDGSRQNDIWQVDLTDLNVMPDPHGMRGAVVTDEQGGVPPRRLTLLEAAVAAALESMSSSDLVQSDRRNIVVIDSRGRPIPRRRRTPMRLEDFLP